MRRPMLALLNALLALGLRSMGLFVAPAMAERSAEEMLQAVDELTAPFAEGRIRMRLTVEERSRQHKLVGEVDAYIARDGDVLAVFRSGRLSGRRILIKEGRAWLIVPGARNAIAMTGEQRLAGAVAVTDVVGLRLLDHYEAILRPEAEIVSGTQYSVLDLAAKRPSIDFPTGSLWITERDGLPRRLLMRLPSGKDAREVIFAGYRRWARATVIERLEVRDLLRKEKRLTVVEFLEYERTRLPVDLFTVEGARAVP